MKLILNDQPVDICSLKLPILISGEDGSGASFFSVFCISELIKSGQKVIFYCLAEQGVELLKEMTSAKCLEENTIIVEPGDRRAFVEAIEGLSDLSQWIIFVKNIEDTLDNELWHLLQSGRGHILSGDVNKCDAITLGDKFNTKIFFSNCCKYNHLQPPELKKYEAEYQGIENSGVLKVVE